MNSCLALQRIKENLFDLQTVNQLKDISAKVNYNFELIQEKLESFKSHLSSVNYEEEAAKHKRTQVYPDETDLRFVSTESENPIDCY